jgi:FkbM family methyltransferase
MGGNFHSNFITGLIKACCQFQPARFDMLTCLPLRKNTFPRIKDILLNILAKSKMPLRLFDPQRAENLRNLFAHYDELTKAYSLLSDEYSRTTYIQVMLFRILGPRHVVLPVFWKQYIDAYNRVAGYLKRRNVDKTSIWTFDEYALKGKNDQIALIVPEGSILSILLLEQYAYRRGNTAIEIEPGDSVIDGGACWGDVAVYAADRIGPNGHVFSFEFVKENLRHFNKNIELNPALKNRISILEYALHSESGKKFSFNSSEGPSTSVERKSVKDDGAVESITIDDLVHKRAIESVDFIKLDIEGSELACLNGAQESIRQFKPKLAIASYHRPQDFWELPLFIHSINPAYRFYFDHFAPNTWESMLYAKSD